MNWINPEFWNAWKQSNISSSKNFKSRNLGSSIEREEKKEVYQIRCSFEENNVEDEMEGGIGVVYALEALWLWVPVAADEVKTPFLFFYDSDILGVFLKVLIGRDKRE